MKSPPSKTSDIAAANVASDDSAAEDSDDADTADDSDDADVAVALFLVDYEKTGGNVTQCCPIRK
jgi:hypothetical protein